MKQSVAGFKDVTKYFGSKLVLDKVSFDLPEGSITTLVGPNGAGKTTIAKMLVGIESATSGEVWSLAGTKFGYVPQKIELNNNLPLTAEYLVKLLTKNRGLSSDLLELADIHNFQKLSVASLSGGQLRRLVLSCCLANQAQVIVLDEPTQDLDAIGQNKFYSLLEKVRKEFGVTILIISHDLHTVVKASDYVLCINKHMCCYGNPSQNYDQILEHIGLYKHKHNHEHEH